MIPFLGIGTLGELREHFGVSRAEMARRMGVAQATVEALDALSITGATVNAVSMYLIGCGGQLEAVVGNRKVQL
jgi:predicted transcriptional regulator